MIISRIKLTNWKNFADAEANLGDVNYIVGANASGKSNFLDVFRFLRDIAKPIGGGLQAAVASRGGFQNICSLNAEQGSSVKIEVDVSDNTDELKLAWKYTLEFSGDNLNHGVARVRIEQVASCAASNRNFFVNQINVGELEDAEIFSQTSLEQVASNKDFRPLVHFFSNITYLHAVPQLIKFNTAIGGRPLEDDPFGQSFLERVANTSEKKRKFCFWKIQNILKMVLPNLIFLDFDFDQMRRPHIKAKFSHHKFDSQWPTEEQFSDGTLRLIALFWQLLDGDNTLLLEEPELSLDEEVIRQMPRMIDELNRIDDETKAKRQIIISTHSSAMLENKGIDARYVLRLEAGEDGTKIYPPSKQDEVMIMSGFSAAEAILPHVHPRNARNMSVT